MFLARALPFVILIFTNAKTSIMEMNTFIMEDLSDGLHNMNHGDFSHEDLNELHQNVNLFDDLEDEYLIEVF